MGRRRGLTRQTAPLIGVLGTAAVTSVAGRSPIGEPERATGHLLPLLRLLHSGGHAVIAALALALATHGVPLPDGTTVLIRNLAGVTGMALLAAVALGASLAWIPPTGYCLLCAAGLEQQWTNAAVWPLRPPHDTMAAAAAATLLAVGLLSFTLRGARDTRHDHAAA